MSAYFDERAFRFLRGIARHNERDWYLAHKADYEAHVRGPFQQLLTDLRPALAEISPHFHADPSPRGGSLFRIRRDTRFRNDKTPYKTWQGARLNHTRWREVETPSFRIHLQPGKSFVGAGYWHPELPTQRRLRQFIFDNPASWQAAAHAPALRRRYRFVDTEMLVRPPRGFPPDFPWIEDLRRRKFALLRELDDADVFSPRLRHTIEADIKRLAPLIDYLCAASDLEF
jgi:uncharacterized protein (TIGR02453 family)